MAKVLEVESGVETVETPEEIEEKKIDGLMNAAIKKVYILGLQNGVKAMCTSVLAEFDKNKTRGLKKQIDAIRNMCLNNLKRRDNSESEKENENAE